MGKVIRLFNEKEAKQEALVKHIEEFLEMAKKGEIKNFLVAAESEEAVLTGYCNLDVSEKQFMLGHIQVDINYEIVKVNMEDLVEWV
jgi:ASC-1-like (ASCH) protein